jgi:hypothetical protein
LQDSGLTFDHYFCFEFGLQDSGLTFDHYFCFEFVLQDSGLTFDQIASHCKLTNGYAAQLFFNQVSFFKISKA